MDNKQQREQVFRPIYNSLPTSLDITASFIKKTLPDTNTAVAPFRSYTSQTHSELWRLTTL